MTDTAATPLQILGEASAAVCDGDFCEIPEHHEQAIINARVDSNNI
jgi:hypothetical protein